MRPLLRLGFKISPRTEPHQAAVALLPRGKQHDARETLARRTCPSGLAAALLLIAEINPKRAANDRLDAVPRQFLGKLQRAEHVVGVGQRQRRLPVLFRNSASRAMVSAPSSNE